jgi:hypothetical protein
MTTDPVRSIADAVLYEGYMLWPYRRSALKNQRRWGFGGVYPPAAEGERSTMQAQCLLEAGPDATVHVSVRFLHVIDRRIATLGADGHWCFVDELTVAGERHLAWEEAVERELTLPPLRMDQAEPAVVPIAVDGGADEEPLGGAGWIIRERRRLRGSIEAAAEAVGPGLQRVTVRVANTTPAEGGKRDELHRRTFCSTHAVLRVDRGGFVSLTDPPPALAELAEQCRNDGSWPVLVGRPGDRSTMLASPIILEDHPRIAPESPGDLFDGGEIDQMLVLNILSLTDEEKAEMRASDPRAREILERTEALTPEQLMRLHGAIREFAEVRR